MGFSLEGSPDATYNGVYSRYCVRSGWPVLKNADGKFCYRHEKATAWVLKVRNDDPIYSDEAPDEDGYVACIESSSGRLPSGSQTWQWAVDGEWVHHSLSVTVLGDDA